MFSLGDILARVKLDTSDVKDGLKDVDDMGQKTKSLGEKIQQGMNVAAVGLGVVGAGLTLFAKNATDRTIEMVANAKSLGREIGTSTEEASRLSAALGRMGIDAGGASSMFGIFAKNIVSSTTNSEQNRLATEKLQIQIEKTKQSIKDTSDEIAKNGDNSGVLNTKLKELNNTLATQEDQLKQSADGFGKLGISTTDANGKQKPFTELLGEVADKFKVMPDGVDKTAIALDLFGRSGKDMIKVLNLGSGGIEDLEKQADDLGLTLNEKTIGAVNDLVQANKDLKQENDALAIAVGTAAAPLQTEFKSALNDVLKAALDTKGPLHDVVVGFLAFGGPVASGLSAFLGVVANLGAAIPVLKGLSNALKLTAASQWLLNAAMDANPIGLIIIGFAALVAAAFLVINHFDKIKKFLDTDLGAAVQVALIGLLPFIGIPLAIAANWDSIKKAAEAVWNWISTNWPLLLAILLGPFALAALDIYTHWEDIKNAAQGAWNFIVGLWQGAGEFFKGIGKSIGDAFSSLGSFISGIFTGAWDGLKNGFKAAINWVVDQANKLIGAYNKTVGKIPGSPHVGNIPGFAKGVENFSGGLAMLGEQGPELGLLPTGTTVVPHNLTQNLVSSLMSVGDTLKSFMGQGLGSFVASNRMTPAMAGGSSSVDARFIVQGDVNIASQQDADYLVERAQNRLDRNAELASMGISTINPPGAPSS